MTRAVPKIRQSSMFCAFLICINRKGLRREGRWRDFRVGITESVRISRSEMISLWGRKVGELCSVSKFKTYSLFRKVIKSIRRRCMQSWLIFMMLFKKIGRNEIWIIASRFEGLANCVNYKTVSNGNLWNSFVLCRLHHVLGAHVLVTYLKTKTE